MKPDAVIKVGGSLFDWPGLPARLTDYLNERAGQRLLLIAGGGAAADAVRALDRMHGLGEERAHALALHALDFTARLLAELVSGLDVVDDEVEIAACWERRRTPVLAVGRWLERDEAHFDDTLPHTWDVTSDTIAAHIAARLGASDLVLLKSAALIGADSHDGVAALGLVDRAFPNTARRVERVRYWNFRDATQRPVPLRPFS